MITRNNNLLALVISLKTNDASEDIINFLLLYKIGVGELYIQPSICLGVCKIYTFGQGREIFVTRVLPARLTPNTWEPVLPNATLFSNNIIN